MTDSQPAIQIAKDYLAQARKQTEPAATIAIAAALIALAESVQGLNEGADRLAGRAEFQDMVALYAS